MLRIIFSWMLFFVLLSVLGCGGSSGPKDLPKLYPCVITITQEGKPLDNAVVELAAAETTDQNNSKYQP
ncbi:MAG: hypothetical protein LBC74_04245 [Planctomycetaceae bacterium]|nr:hypothetical protein [Planctomycetaceae bacterium]